MDPYIPKPLPPKSIEWEMHITSMVKANRMLAKYGGILHSIINPDVLLTPLTINEAVLSSRIEGTQASLEEVLQYGGDSNKQIESEKRDDIQEVINYHLAMEMAVGALKKRPLCVNTICDIHRILLTGVRGISKQPGEIRHTQNYIATPGSPIEKAIFIPPEPGIVMDALSNWENYLHQDEDEAKDFLVQLALVKAQFELIHPFLDGNGRIGRMLVPLVLYYKGLIPRPAFYVSSYLERHRDVYYERLGAISRDEDWNGWISFFLGAVQDQADENSRKALAIRDLYNIMKDKIPEITRSPSTIKAIDTIFSQPIFSSTYFSEKSEIKSRETSTRMLRELRDNGILDILREASGRRPATYIFTELLKIIQQEESDT